MKLKKIVLLQDRNHDVMVSYDANTIDWDEYQAIVLSRKDARNIIYILQRINWKKVKNC